MRIRVAIALLALLLIGLTGRTLTATEQNRSRLGRLGNRKTTVMTVPGETVIRETQAPPVTIVREVIRERNTFTAAAVPASSTTSSSTSTSTTTTVCPVHAQGVRLCNDSNTSPPR
jgi:hypothetical protein